MEKKEANALQKLEDNIVLNETG